VGFVYYQDISSMWDLLYITSPVWDLFCLVKLHESHVGFILHYCVQYLPTRFEMFMFNECVVY
jgi:hypothetical protein